MAKEVEIMRETLAAIVRIIKLDIFQANIWSHFLEQINFKGA